MVTYPTKKLGERKTFDEIIHSWLKDEWYLSNYNQVRQITPSEFINNPNFSNTEENKVRLELLRSIRSPMVDPLPKDTEWYVTDLKKGDIKRIYIVPSSDWLSLTSNSYSILEAVKNIDSNLDHASKIREIKTNLNEGSLSKNLILVASSPESPFTIIEGNHRAVALLSKAIDSKIEPIVEKIFLGISPEMKSYIWHIESRVKNEK